VISVLLSAGAAIEARAQVSAVGDDEMSDESESEFSRLVSKDTSALCLSQRPCGGGLCVVVSWGCSSSSRLGECSRIR
jgi:hypothetical protein